ncbi:hypothetical protein niasHT_025431 [Heterodera trifolii]|uniref:Poly(A) RNA polymerase mitochondrial-like central palm domain-containing protein n=1 Tax=Heterodera trifolii TaxID=157864 RepID=A0ABD2JXL3_9BILA
MVSKSAPTMRYQLNGVIVEQQPHCVADAFSPPSHHHRHHLNHQQQHQQLQHNQQQQQHLVMLQQCRISDGSAANTEDTGTQPNSGRSSSSSSERSVEQDTASSSSPQPKSSSNNSGDSVVVHHANNSTHFYYMHNFNQQNLSPQQVSEVKRQVWVRRNRKYAPTLEGLHDEILDLYQWLKPTAEETAIRWSLYNKISRILRHVWHQAEVSMYGSVATNSFLPSSDIDICVKISDFRIHDELPKLADVLRTTNLFDNIVILDKTAVPIVKFTDRQTQLSIDVSFNLTHVADTVKWIRRKLNELPLLEPLLLLLKQLLSQNNLNNPFNGGLPSYALVVMLVYFLENIRFDKGLPKLTDCATLLGRRPLGILFHYFLYYYGFALNPACFGIRVAQNMELVPREELVHQFGDPSMFTSGFCIADPVQTDNNIGRGAHNVVAIRCAFWQAYNSIVQVIAYCAGLDEQLKRCYCGPLLSLILHFDVAMVARRANTVAIARRLLFQLVKQANRRRVHQRRQLKQQQQPEDGDDQQQQDDGVAGGGGDERVEEGDNDGDDQLQEEEDNDDDFIDDDAVVCFQSD